MLLDGISKEGVIDLHSGSFLVMKRIGFCPPVPLLGNDAVQPRMDPGPVFTLLELCARCGGLQSRRFI